MTTSAPLRFLISSSPSALREALAGFRSVTIEAEYGDEVVEGSIATLAHHGPRAGAKCPCQYDNGFDGGLAEVVGLSHFDLDTLGGCMALMGMKPLDPGFATFWDLAEFIDLRGPHRLAESGASAEDVRRLQAFWAWSQSFRVFAPRDGSVADVSEQVREGARVLFRILSDDSTLLAAGDSFAAAGEELNRSSFRGLQYGVVRRVADCFVNHLYTAPNGKVGRAVVALNTATGAITVSFADPVPGVSCVEIVQALWGPLAGGHAGIAGSPRGRVMTRDDLEAAVHATRCTVVFARWKCHHCGWVGLPIEGGCGGCGQSHADWTMV